MTLLNSEQVISRIDTGHGELVLTSHRVVHGWETQFTSILLADVGSVVVARLTHRWMLFVIGTCVLMAAGLVALAFGSGGFGPVDIYRQLASALLFLSAFLVVTFGVKRFSMVQITSPQASIELRVRSVIRKDLNRFLVNLDKARIVWYFANKETRGIQDHRVPLQRRVS